MLNVRTALVAAIVAIAAPAAAQDFTSIDFNAVNSQWWGGQVGEMNGMVGNMIANNVANPQVQSMYYAAVQQGYAGSIEQFAYSYAENGGFTPEGIATNRQVSADIANRTAEQNAGYFASQDTYKDAYTAYTNGFSENLNEAGLGLGGQSTYQTPYGEQVLPHTWGADTYHTQNGNSYYTDNAGQYWMADPNNSGMWYGLN